MKNISSIVLLLAASASYVASMPTAAGQQIEVRGAAQDSQPLLLVERKKNKGNATAAAAAAATGDQKAGKAAAKGAKNK